MCVQYYLQDPHSHALAAQLGHFDAKTRILYIVEDGYEQAADRKKERGRGERAGAGTWKGKNMEKESTQTIMKLLN